MTTRAVGYLHALPGRLRIKILRIKHLPARALQLEAQLRQVAGIIQVKANPLTGNVLVRHDPDRLPQDQVLAALRSLGYLEPPAPAPTESGGVKAFGCRLARQSVKRVVKALSAAARTRRGAPAQPGLARDLALAVAPVLAEVAVKAVVRRLMV
jgi:hypothetical protein